MGRDSVNQAFISRWQEFYGSQKTRNILNRLRGTDPKIITPNFLKIGFNDLRERLTNKDFKLKALPDWNSLIVKEEPFNIASSPEYLSGMFSIQALTSLIPPRVLAPTSDSLVADLAAAPGIKTCLLAQEMENRGTIIAFDKSKQRMTALKANIARMGVLNTIVLHFDSTNLSKLNLQFDHILLDAPCSGTGLKFGKNKKLSPKSLKDVERHAQIQKKLLESAWSQLKEKGTLVYSVCSLEPEEGEIQISRFLEKYPDAKILGIPLEKGEPGFIPGTTPHPDLNKTRRILPQSGYDGFFVALIQKG